MKKKPYRAGLKKTKTKYEVNVTKIHYKAIQWCINNKIYVSALPTINGLKIEINHNKKITISDKTYSQNELQNKLWELYLYLYKQNN
jgi:hypothetical protein